MPQEPLLIHSLVRVCTELAAAKPSRKFGAFVDPGTITGFKKRIAQERDHWPRNIDSIVDGYEHVTGVDKVKIWQLALDDWGKALAASSPPGDGNEPDQSRPPRPSTDTPSVHATRRGRGSGRRRGSQGPASLRAAG